jgi:hypothetical protein
MKPVVVLSHAEVMQAAQAGIMRLVGNMKRGLSDRYGAPQTDRWGIDIEGACGEMAVAKYLGLYWSGAIGNFYAADVGRLQVRTTGHPNGRLILHEEDRDDHVFILATGRAPQFTIEGWLQGVLGKSEKWWIDSGRPAFFVPREALFAIDTLIDEVRKVAAE